MKTGLIGVGYWGSILKLKLEVLSDLQWAIDSKTDYKKIEGLVDWVFIATPAKTHYEIVKYWLNNGVNVFCEKPLCLTSKEAEELFILADDMEVKLFVDNIFLERDELKNIKINSYPNHICNFTWNKNRLGNDKFEYELLYHDLAILLFLFGNEQIRNIEIFENNKTNYDITFDYGTSLINIEYRFNFKGGNRKELEIDGFKYDFTNPTKDYLFYLINNCLAGNVNFQENQRMSINTIKLLEEFI